jgi:ornithine cyclodeaminase
MQPSAAVPVIDAATVRARLAYPALLDALAEAFRDPPATTPRQALPYRARDDAHGSVLLLMSAVDADRLGGVKIVTFNAGRAEGAVRYIYIAFDPASGAPLALLDGEALSSRRTAAVSALAARTLARSDAARVLVVGTGAVARELVPAYAAAFPGAAISIWGRRPEAAAALAAAVAAADGLTATPVADLDAAVAAADIVTTATAATVPLIRGDRLAAGAHVDLIGGFSATMRESDDAVMRRAAAIVVDNPAAIAEAGDLTQPIAAGVVDAAGVATLGAVLAGTAAGRRAPGDITVFKSVGHALADLAAARLVVGGR